MILEVGIAAKHASELGAHEVDRLALDGGEVAVAFMRAEDGLEVLGILCHLEV